MCTAFAPFDITAGDTLRLNLAMPSDAPAGTCTFQAAIVQSTADTCLECRLAGPSTFTLRPGQSTALEYVGAYRVRARPVLQPQIEPNTRCGPVTASVEIYDTISRRTRLLDSGTRLNTPDRDEVPAGPPSYPSAGLTSADTMRINVFFEPAGPPNIPAGPPTDAVCTVHATISCPGGCSLPSGPPQSVLSQTTAILRPGQSATLSYSDATIATRRQVRPAISMQGPAASCGNVVTTTELLDTAAGRTFALFHCPGGCTLPSGPPQ